VLFVDEAHLETGRELRERCASLRELVLTGAAGRPSDCLRYEELLAHAPAVLPELPGERLAIISYTGGTTGRPKGVMLSHENVLANSKHNQMLMRYAADDVYLHSAPMFHIADACLTFSVTWAGGAHCFLPRFDPAGVSRAIAEHGVTLLVMVPTMIQAWLAELEAHPVDLRGVRAMVYAGSPIAAELQERAIASLPFELWQGYGMTEASPSLAYLTAEDHARGLRGGEAERARLRSGGRPVRGVQVRICAPGGELVGVGVVGEIEARGPNLMLGYWNEPQATEAAMHDGWYRTGDAGYLDADGYLFVVDRIKDMIISGGENVYSVEVERALLAHPDVVEAAVFGLPDERWGEAVSAVVTVRERSAVDADALIEHCRAHIAGYKIPRSIAIAAEPLPKSGAGKVLKHELRASRLRETADAR
jgi:long-chain acyl-CoA synthetase